MDISVIAQSISGRVDIENPAYLVDGLEYCALCNTPRQKKIIICGRELTVNMMCRCLEEKVRREEKEYRERQREQSIMRNISAGLCQAAYREMTFDNSNEILSREISYCRNFSEMMNLNSGILFTGSTGTGKTFRAGCIANELLRNGYTVYMDGITSLCNKIQQSINGRYEFIESLCRYDLLVLDDLGAERRTEYMSELVYSIIDSRYNSSKPLIVTTNITLNGLKTESDINCRRTYDRIIEMCSYPIVLTEQSKRRTVAKDKYNAVRSILETETL